MAACLITVSGTSGSVLVRYKDSGSVDRELNSGLGTFYLEDDGSDYTYTTMSGDAIATPDVCITMTELPFTCYIISWELDRRFYNPFNTKFSSVVIGTTEYSLPTETPYPFDRSISLCESINTLDLMEVKATGFKITVPTDTSVAAETCIILRVTGTDIPYLKIRNEDNTHFIYLKGELTADCLPTGYTEIDISSEPLSL